MQTDREELSPKAKARRAPHTPGVYLMKDPAGLVVYVGKAKDLKKRLASYFIPRQRMTPKVAAMMDTVADLEWHEVRSETEALLLEGKLIKRWRPRWNILFRDDKQFPQIRVDLADPIPRFRIVRARNSDSARYFGPFPHQQAVRRTINEMRKKFGILLIDANPAPLPDGRWRLYGDVRSQIQKFPNEVTAEEYGERVTAACAFLEGKAGEWAEQTEADMRAAAAARDYEKAAELRDLLDALRRTTEKSRRFLRENPLPRRDESGRWTPWPRRWGCRARPRRRSASTSRISRGPSRSPRWCASSMARPTRPATDGSRSSRSRATMTSVRWRRSSAGVIPVWPRRDGPSPNWSSSTAASGRWARPSPPSGRPA
jgi:predicted GIY-YIG superfamily endonuclease